MDLTCHNTQSHDDIVLSSSIDTISNTDKDILDVYEDLENDLESPIIDIEREQHISVFASLNLDDISDEEVRRLIDEILYPAQRVGFWLQVSLTLKYGVVAHVSRGGAGKTVMVLLLARYLRMDIATFAKPTPLQTWVVEAPRFGVNIAYQMSVDSLKGKKGATKGLEMKILKRTDDDEYEETDELKKIFSKPLIVVFDETHYAKTKETLINKSLSVVARCARELGCPVMNITGTPGSQASEAEALVRLTGAIGPGQMIGYAPISRTYVPLAITPFIQFCEKIDMTTTKMILSRTIAPNTLQDILFKLYTTVVIPAIRVDVPVDAPPIYYHTLHCSLTGEPQNAAVHANKTRSAAIGIAKTKGSGKEKIYAANNCYDDRLEMLKVKHVIPVKIAERTRENPMRKSVVFLKTHEAMYSLAAEMEILFPGRVVVVNCMTPKKKSDRIIIFNRFREDNDDLKVVITSKDIGGVSISMDDRRGNRPRDVYGTGDRAKERKQQSYWRTSRATSQSPTNIFEIYIEGISAEKEKEKSSLTKEKFMEAYRGVSKKTLPSFLMAL